MSLLALFMAASSFAQAPKLLYYGVESPTAGLVAGSAVATTGSGTPSPYIVVATLNSTATGQPLQLQFWNATGTTTAGKLAYVTTATWNPEPGGCVSYALATLDSSKIVAVCGDTFNNLHLSVWRVAGASPSDFYEMGEQSVASSGIAESGSYVSVTALSPTEVVTAATDPSQNLRVQTWNIAITGSSTEPFATVTQQHTAIAGAIWFPFVVALNGTQVVTATDSYTTPPSTRKVIAWSVDSSGDITRSPHDLEVATDGTSAISGIALAPLGGLFGNYEVMTVTQVIPASYGSNHPTYVTSWDISSTGVVTGGNSGSGTEQNIADGSSVGIAWTPSLYPFTVSLTTSDSGVNGGRAEQWHYSAAWSVLDGTNVGGNQPNPFSGVAVASAGNDSTLAYYVVTYTGEGGDVNIQVWSAPIT